MDEYLDPLEAAKKRQVPANRGASYFPGAIPQAQFIGQYGNLYTAPADISRPQIRNAKGKIIDPGLIDARAPVVFGGALSPSSLTPQAAWQAQFQPGNIAQQTQGAGLRQVPIIAQQTMGGQGLRTATRFTDIKAQTAPQPLRTASPTLNLDELVKRYAY